LTNPQQPVAPVPQPVLSPPAGTAIFLVVRVNPGGERAVRGLLPDLASLQRSVSARVPAGALTCVAGIGSAAWDRLFGGPRPAGLHPFPELAGAKYIAIATPGDLLFHIKALSMNLCFEMTAQIMDRLSGAVTVEDEVHGFRYFEERDLLGFVGGAENPCGPAATEAVLVGGEDPRFAGGSYVIAQKYLHDLRAWNALPVEQQEKVLGRRKLSNIALPSGTRPGNSHVALTATAAPGGARRPILRDKMPFGSAGRGEFGTYFTGYAAHPGVIEQMLTSMFIGDPPGNYDRILDFSAAVTGGLFFAPSADFLGDPPGPPGLPARSAAVREPDLADEPAPPGIPQPSPGTAEHIGGLTRSGPAVTIPPHA
jgi:porphyrinogen peroxidase